MIHFIDDEALRTSLGIASTPSILLILEISIPPKSISVNGLVCVCVCVCVCVLTLLLLFSKAPFTILEWLLFACIQILLLFEVEETRAKALTQMDPVCHSGSAAEFLRTSLGLWVSVPCSLKSIHTYIIYIIDLQYCVSFRCTGKWFSYMYIHFFQIIFHYVIIKCWI